MRPEHVRLQLAEKDFGHKNLLHAQLETLSLLKHYEAYKLLRTEEFLLKIALKNKIEEAKASLALLEKLLPKPTIQAPKEEHSHATLHTHKERRTLDDEINEIRRKLAQLKY